VALDAAAQIEAKRIEVDDYIKAHAATTTEAYKEAGREETAAAVAFEKARVAADDAATKAIGDNVRKAAADFKQRWDAAINPMVHTFVSGLADMAQGTKNFRQVMVSQTQDLINDFDRMVETNVEKWLWGEIGKTVATTIQGQARVTAQAAATGEGEAISRAANLREVFAAAKVAMANTYKSVSAIPVIGPFIAPEAAAAAFGAVMAFGSFDKGMDIMPHDAIVQVHAGERIVPASDNSAIISAMRGGGGGGGGHTINVGDTHINGANMGPRELAAMLSDHPHIVAKLVDRVLRDNIRPRG
jgi:hypothetical protein